MTLYFSKIKLHTTGTHNKEMTMPGVGVLLDKLYLRGKNELIFSFLLLFGFLLLSIGKYYFPNWGEKKFFEHFMLPYIKCWILLQKCKGSKPHEEK